MQKYWVGLLGLAWSLASYGVCIPKGKPGTPVEEFQDVLAVVLRSVDRCPQSVFELTHALQGDGLKTKPYMVANRGRHNPRFGSFSFFEIAIGPSLQLKREVNPGHIYFGHFTQAEAGTIELDQTPSPEKLLIELIAWDFSKEMYNFYELIGTTSGGTWFYRGDSRDAFLDNSRLHLQANPQNPQFGRNMRCSGCHTSGGPILKELDAPHNDWWTKARPLPLLPNRPSAQVAKWLAATEAATEFADDVRKGMGLLEQSRPMRTFKQQLSLPERLRPLFCTTEINLVSDMHPLEAVGKTIAVPSRYFVNPLLTDGNPPEIEKLLYEETIKALGFQFPETNRQDADHAWLAPVKGDSDQMAILTLVDEGTVTREFVLDVLAVDFTQPLFSSSRCQLLRAVPPQATANWEADFRKNLRTEASPAARALLDHLENAEKTSAFHTEAAKRYLQGIKIDSPATAHKAILQLEATRKSVFTNEISKNPRGQIFEPGFRVIFPVRGG